MSGLRLYRIFDLTVLSVLAILAEGLGIVAATRFSGAGFFISFSSLVVLIALIRWKQYGVLVSVMTTVALLLLNDTASFPLLLYYLLSNSAVILIPILFHRRPVSSIVENPYLLFAYMSCYYGTLFVSRGFSGALIGLSFAESFAQNLAQLSLSMVMTFVFLLMLRKKEGLLVDMTTYIYKEVIQE